MLADLLGAVRLPSGALRPHMPGTDSVTDLLLFTRRPPGQPSRSRDFIETVHVPIDGAPLRVNTYFDRHPEHVLGRTGAIHRPRALPILTVTNSPGRWPTEFHQALGHITATAHADGIAHEPRHPQPAMAVLAVHHETKTPHTPAPRPVPPRPDAVRRNGPGPFGLSMN